MRNLVEQELQTVINGVFQICLEEGIEDVKTIWELVCDETDTDYDDLDGIVGEIFENECEQWDL
jgi:hypothetical protein